MIYDPIELTAADLVTHFDADLTAIATAKGVLAQIDATPTTIYKDKDSMLFVGITPKPGEKNLPGLGIYVIGGMTQAKNAGVREATLQMVFDYFARGVDAGNLLTQTKLAVEAILLEVDRMYGLNSGGANPSGITEAGKDERSVVIDIGPGLKMAGGDYYEQNATVTVPVEARDVGL